MGKQAAKLWAKRIMFLGLAIPLLPIVLWILNTIGCENPFSEDSCAGATYLWILLPAIPTGILVVLFGFIVWLVARFANRQR
jgi:hypothetical protein